MIDSNIIISKYQKEIYKQLKSKDNLLIEAVAGSGKTTTLIKGLDIVKGKTIFVAFNKHIADNIKAENVKTLHALGLSIIKNQRSIKVEPKKINNTLKKYFGNYEKAKKWWYNVPKCISLMKATGLDVNEICNNHDIEMISGLEDIVHEIFDLSKKDKKTIDFDDMIYLPVVEEMKFESYDNVFVDEAQDLNPIQIDFLDRMGGRLVAVGDTYQSIYAFRGADELSMGHIKDRFNCKQLPLSICYRCGDQIVAEAKKIVPHIEGTDSKGKVSKVSRPIFKENDVVLCRITADLINQCIKTMAKGIKAYVKGRNIGLELQRYMTKFPNDKLSETETDRLCSIKPNLTIFLRDRHESACLLRGKKNIFSDNGVGVCFSTIHRSKGTEADRVYILRDDLLPHPRGNKQQELNIKYVAITRAKKELLWIQ